MRSVFYYIYLYSDIHVSISSFRFILDLAVELGSLVISNDKYRDLYPEKKRMESSHTIETFFIFYLVTW